MKKQYKYLTLGIIALAICFTSCKEDEGIVPTVDLSTLNFKSTPGEGEIVLTWETPKADPGYSYLKMEYTDPREKKYRNVTISTYTNTLVINNTRARYGNAYNFKFTPYSETDTPGMSYTLEGCKSGPAKKTTTTSREPIKLTSSDLYSNAAEPSEGKLEYLVDGLITQSSFFHTAWSVTVADPYHYVDIDLKENIDRFEIDAWNRVAGGGNNPTEVKLYRILKLADNAVDMDHPLYSYNPATTGQGEENVEMYPAEDQPALNEPVRFLRFCAKSSAIFWHLSELIINKITINNFDPEVDEVAEYDGNR